MSVSDTAVVSPATSPGSNNGGRLAVAPHFGQPAGSRQYERSSGGRGLQRDDAERFVAAGHDDGVRAGEQARQFLL